MNEYIVKRIPIPVRDFTSDPRLIVIRSFDVNRPGAEVDELKGGVAGGSILTGVLRVGQQVEVRPGIVTKDGEGKVQCKPIFSKIVTLLAEQNELKYAVPGGLIGVGTTIDPTLCRADRLVGQVLGLPGKLPQIYTGGVCPTTGYITSSLCFRSQSSKSVSSCSVDSWVSRQMTRNRQRYISQTHSRNQISYLSHIQVQKLSKNEVLMVNIGSTSTGGRVISVKADLAKILLTTPACTEVGEKVALSRRIDKHWVSWFGLLYRERYLRLGSASFSDSSVSFAFLSLTLLRGFQLMISFRRLGKRAQRYYS